MLPVSPQKTLRQMQDEIGAWGDATFPTSTFISVASHFEEEAAEFLAEIRSGESVDAVLNELADCAILLIQFAHKNGFDLSQVIERKMAINRARTWNTTPEPEGHFKHVEVEARS